MEIQRLLTSNLTLKTQGVALQEHIVTLENLVTIKGDLTDSLKNAEEKILALEAKDKRGTRKQSELELIIESDSRKVLELEQIIDSFKAYLKEKEQVRLDADSPKMLVRNKPEEVHRGAQVPVPSLHPGSR